MTIQSYTMGPGVFSLGTDPDDLDVSCQVKSLRIQCKENVTKGARTPMLCGEDKVDADKVTHDWTVSGKILQDVAAGGVVDFTWTHKGDSLAFRFVPNTVKDRVASGIVRCVPLDLGGDAGTDPDSDFTWVCPADEAEPILGDATP